MTRSKTGLRRLVLFELPETVRILRENAFWDIYYEHCSYFTAGSLARLFRTNRFDVVELELAFGGQYLLLAARPSNMPTAPALPLEDDLDALTTDVETFFGSHRETMVRWQTQLDAWHADGQRTILWGAGSKAVAFVSTLEITDQIDYLVDINPFKWKQFLPGSGHPVVGPDFLSEQPPDRIIVMNPIYSGEIGRTISKLDFDAHILTVHLPT